MEEYFLYADNAVIKGIKNLPLRKIVYRWDLDPYMTHHLVPEGLENILSSSIVNIYKGNSIYRLSIYMIFLLGPEL